MNADIVGEVRPGARGNVEQEHRALNFTRARKSNGHIDEHCVSIVHPDSYEAGQYLRLRYALETTQVTDRGAVIGICSPASGDGKSVTAMNLAGALAQRKGREVLVIDADIRRRSRAIRSLVPVSGALAPGLVELLLRGRSDPAEAARKVEHTGISVLLSGSLSISPYELFSSQRFGELVTRAREQYDYVVIDAPPVLAVPDCKVLSQWTDGFVVVVSANSTPRIMLAQTLELLGPENVMGLILNKCDQLPSRYYRYYGKYGYASSATRRKGSSAAKPASVPPTKTGQEGARELGKRS